MANDPNTYSFSSSSVMSYSSDGQGQPKYFQATKSTKKAPGGVGIAVPGVHTIFILISSHVSSRAEDNFCRRIVD